MEKREERATSSISLHKSQVKRRLQNHSRKMLTANRQRMELGFGYRSGAPKKELQAEASYPSSLNIHLRSGME